MFFVARILGRGFFLADWRVLHDVRDRFNDVLGCFRRKLASPAQAVNYLKCFCIFWAVAGKSE